MTGNLEGLLPGAKVLLHVAAVDQPRRGVVLRRVNAAFGDGLTIEVCVGPCHRPEHNSDCPTVGFAPDDLLLVPAEQAS